MKANSSLPAHHFLNSKIIKLFSYCFVHFFRERARIAAKGLLNSTAEVSGIQGTFFKKKTFVLFYKLDAQPLKTFNLSYSSNQNDPF